MHAGWGIRIVSITTAGCVPVTIQDHVAQPYQDFLNYDDFGLVLRNADVPRLPEILRAVPMDTVARKRAKVKMYASAFIWELEAGGTAYNLTIASLWRRMQNFWAGADREELSAAL